MSENSQKLRCQSCGMPLGDGFFGTESDGSVTSEYCSFCYQKGAFTKSEMTVTEMIALSVENMVTQLGFDEDKAKELAESFIPKLKRWHIKSH